MTKKEFTYTVVLTIVLSSLAFACHEFGLTGYGYTFFLLMPLAIGFILGQRPGWKIPMLASVLFGFVTFMYLLLIAQLEGIICIVMASPLIVGLMFLGIWGGYAIRKAFPKKDKEKFKFSFFPIIAVLLAGVTEHYFSEKYDYGKIETVIYLPYDKETVFDHIKSVDTLDSEKPFLMQIGLSVPQKCILEKEEVGASRICYFKEGTIDEKVTEIKRGEILKMDVTRYGLPGRKWLKFKDAIYLFKEKNNGTELTRITTYRTELKPRFYWAYWEKISIEAEHDYVLHDLERRLKEKK
jgi:hypothetical protein